VYRALVATWPFQVRRCELGSLIDRFDVAHEKILEAGFASQQVTDAVSSELQPRIESVSWAELSRSQRKTEWLRLCLSAVKRLERLLVELKSQRRMEEEGFHSIGATGHQQSSPSLSANSKNDSRSNDLSTKRQNRRNRARRLAASAVKTPKPSMDTGVSGKVRKVTVDLPLVDGYAREQERPMFRVRRLRMSGTTEHKNLAAQNIQPPLRIRRLGINESVEKKRLAARLASITERTQQHMKRQQLRSQRRMQLLSMRMAWNRRVEEKAAAGDELWQQAQEKQHASPHQDDVQAWPRLSRWQGEQLADEVQAFIRGTR